MYSRIFFLLVIVCAVNASVFTVNVYDDNPETEFASSLKGCNPQECDQRCRRLKFPGGACVNGRCKCDNFLNVEDDMSVEEPAILEDLVSLEVDKPETEVASSPKGCNNQECDQRCRRLKFRGGVCVNGRCKCDLFSDAKVDDPEVTSLPENCNPQECDQRCRRLKFPGGACVNGRCKCDNFFNAGDIMTDPAESLRSCYPLSCDNQCRRRGFHHGVCINGECKCDFILDSEVFEGSLSESEVSDSQRRCTHQACNNLCRGFGFREGICDGARCTCHNVSPTSEVALDENPQVDAKRYCNLTQCNQTCARRGYDGARCIHGWCKCYNKMERQDASPLNDVTGDVNEVSNDILGAVADLTDVSPRACNPATCNQVCRALNYRGGWCRFGQCQCF